MSKNWLVDITTLNGVESMFHSDGIKDFAAQELAGKLADFYAYSTDARFILPSPGPRATGPMAPSVPAIVASLQAHDTFAFRPLTYLTENRRVLDENFMEEAIQNFLAWCSVNPTKLKQWLRLHSEHWISGGHADRVASRYVYEIRAVEGHQRFVQAVQVLNVSASDLAYAFDVALRYGYYGELAAGGVYLSHPIREGPRLPSQTIEQSNLPPIALSFAPSVAGLARSLTLDQYTSLLHELRRVVQDKQLARVRPGAVENRVIREIAADLNLPVQLRSWAKAVGVTAALLGGVAAIPTLSTAAALVGAGIGIGGLFWNGSLPPRAGRTKWIRWALRWSLEDTSAA